MNTTQVVTISLINYECCCLLIGGFIGAGVTMLLSHMIRSIADLEKNAKK